MKSDRDPGPRDRESSEDLRSAGCCCPPHWGATPACMAPAGIGALLKSRQTLQSRSTGIDQADTAHMGLGGNVCVRD